MKNLVIVFLLVASQGFAQAKYLTRTGEINFEASVPSFEEVAAKNESVTAIINTESGEIAALALVKGFRFKNALMEEHFNENYAESEEYPKTTFKGKIADFRLPDDGETIEAIINGELEFHGEKNSLKEVKVSLKREGNNLSIQGEFVALASDFNIEIPKIVSKKLRDDVKVNFNFNLEAQ